MKKLTKIQQLGAIQNSEISTNFFKLMIVAMKQIKIKSFIRFSFEHENNIYELTFLKMDKSKIICDKPKNAK